MTKMTTTAETTAKLASVRHQFVYFFFVGGHVNIFELKLY